MRVVRVVCRVSCVVLGCVLILCDVRARRWEVAAVAVEAARVDVAEQGGGAGLQLRGVVLHALPGGLRRAVLPAAQVRPVLPVQPHHRRPVQDRLLVQRPQRARGEDGRHHRRLAVHARAPDPRRSLHPLRWLRLRTRRTPSFVLRSFLFAFRFCSFRVKNIGVIHVGA